MFSKRETAEAPCVVRIRRALAWLLAACAGTCNVAALADGVGASEADLASLGAEPGRNVSKPRLELSVSSYATPSLNSPSGSQSVSSMSRGDQRNYGPRDNSPTPLRLEISSWSHPPQQSAMGLALGVDTASSGWTENRSGSFVDVGVRWRSAPVNQRRIDVVAFRRLNQPNQPQDAYTLINTAGEPIYSARVEMQFQSAKFGGLAPELGAIGMQLNGGGKVVLRTKRGGPMVYYRAKF
jgi:hypothetical protein